MLSINPKGAPGYEIPNIVSLIAMTNHRSQGLTLSEHDRRWYPYWSPAKPKTQAYYERLAAFVHSAGGLAVWHHMATRSIEDFPAKSTAPHSQYKAELIEVSEHPVRALLRERLEERRAPFVDDVVRMDDILEFLDDKRMDSGKVGGFLREIGAEKRRIQRKINGRVETKRIWIVRRHDHFHAMSDVDLFRMMEAVNAY